MEALTRPCRKKLAEPIQDMRMEPILVTSAAERIHVIQSIDREFNHKRRMGQQSEAPAPPAERRATLIPPLVKPEAKAAPTPVKESPAERLKRLMREKLNATQQKDSAESERKREEAERERLMRLDDLRVQRMHAKSPGRYASPLSCTGSLTRPRDARPRSPERRRSRSRSPEPRRRSRSRSRSPPRRRSRSRSRSPAHRSRSPPRRYARPAPCAHLALCSCSAVAEAPRGAVAAAAAADRRRGVATMCAFGSALSSLLLIECTGRETAAVSVFI